MAIGPSVTHVNDERLIEAVGKAKGRIVFLAPGLSEAVARALADAWSRLGRDAVSVILDADPEVCRMGYGKVEGLEAVRDAAACHGRSVGYQPGLRIGVLIADDLTLIFTPTPLLIQAEAKGPEEPNAIELVSPPPALAESVGIGAEGLPEQPHDLAPVTPARIEEIKQDLRVAPPMKFDLARRVRVFTSRFQFVELQMTGCFVSRKKVRVPSSLVGLAGTKDVERQFHAHFDLVAKGRLEVKTGNVVLTEQSLFESRREIERDFLVTLPGYGKVLLRANKDRFEAKVDELRTKVTTFSSGVTERLQSMIESSRQAVVDALFPAVQRNPPNQYTKTHGLAPREDVLRGMLEEDIKRAFGSADALVAKMEVTCVFKDVAYESLVDEKFIATARKAMPEVTLLHDEFEATPARGDARA